MSEAAPKILPLTLCAAEDGGFFVADVGLQQVGGGFKIVFSGALDECLMYLKRAFTPAQKVSSETFSYVEGFAKFPDVDLEALHGEYLARFGEKGIHHDLNSLSPTILMNNLKMCAAGEGIASFRIKPEHAKWLLECLGEGDHLDGLEAVLDDLRLNGVEAGIQLFGQGVAVAWTGDIEDALRPWPSVSLRSPGDRPLTTFHRSEGTDCLEDAAKWLRQQNTRIKIVSADRPE